jgi:hypothetical protein
MLGIADFGIVLRTGFVVANAGEMSHDQTGGDRRRFLRECRAIFLNGSVEVELALLPKLHGSGRGKGLGNRSQAKESVLAGGDVVFEVCKTIAGGPFELSVFHDRDGDAGNVS